MTLRHALLPLATAAFALAGCHIESHGCWRSNVPDRGNQVCENYCDRLVSCDSIQYATFDRCMDQCTQAWVSDSVSTESGCSCVEADVCRAIGDYHCPGAPIVWDGSTGGSTGYVTTSGGSTGYSTTGHGSSGSTGYSTTGGTTTGTTTGTTGTSSGTTTGTTTGGTTGGGACTRNQDCALNQDCISGVCLNRCHASCECAANQVCGTDGYCRSNAPPPQACQADCQCASGHHCVSGFCQ